MSITSKHWFPTMVFLSCLLVFGNTLAGVNYCHDDSVNQDWENLANNSSEPEVKELYTLRKALCQKVDQGELELDSAIDMFESERIKKIQAIKRRKMRLDDSLSSPQPAG